MSPGSAAAVIALASALAALCAARAADLAGYDEKALCVAVIESRSDDLARQVRDGDKSQQPALHTELVRAAVLIGQAWLDGLHDEHEARAMLQNARDAQAAWSEARRNTTHDECIKKADAALANASALQRFIVERIAQRREERMLASP